MNILQSWSNSLTLLKPSSLKLFLLVTLKSIIESYKLMFTTFLPLMIGCIAASLFLFSFLGLLSFLATLFLWCLIIRPSVLKKDYSYIKGYWSHFVLYILGAVLLSLLVIAIGCTFNWGIYFNNRLLIDLCIFIIETFGWLLIALQLFFFLDSDAKGFTGASIIRAGKMVLYNLPFVVIALNAFSLLLSVPIYLMRLIALPFLAVGVLNFLVFMPIVLCFWNNFYIKNIHENFNLYFKSKEA